MSPLKTKQNYYDILGVESSADEEALKKAYRKKSLQMHPDKLRNSPERVELEKKRAVANEASKRARAEFLVDEKNLDKKVALDAALKQEEEMKQRLQAHDDKISEEFKKLQNAYETLSDAEQRKRYDHEKFKQNAVKTPQEVPVKETQSDQPKTKRSYATPKPKQMRGTFDNYDPYSSRYNDHPAQSPIFSDPNWAPPVRRQEPAMNDATKIIFTMMFAKACNDLEQAAKRYTQQTSTQKPVRDDMSPTTKAAKALPKKYIVVEFDPMDVLKYQLLRILMKSGASHNHTAAIFGREPWEKASQLNKEESNCRPAGMKVR